MLYIENNCLDPWFNLSVEEFYLNNKEIEDDILMLWQNNESIIIGRHQNIVSEVNVNFANLNNIKIARRISGGGAVYHDLGNLNYTFITSFNNGVDLNYKIFADTVIAALQEMGVNASRSGRNDIIVDNKKISGTAQACVGNRLMFHGTLLYDLNADVAAKALNVDKTKLEAKGIKSVKSRIGNLKPYFPENFSINMFKERLKTSFLCLENSRSRVIESEELESINDLYDNKHSTNEWIYGESLRCNLISSRRLDCGNLDIYLNLDKGKINQCRILGDYIGIYGTEDIEDAVIGCNYQYSEIKKALMKFNLSDYFGKISIEELVACFL